MQRGPSVMSPPGNIISNRIPKMNNTGCSEYGKSQDFGLSITICTVILHLLGAQQCQLHLKFNLGTIVPQSSLTQEHYPLATNESWYQCRTTQLAYVRNSKCIPMKQVLEDSLGNSSVLTGNPIPFSPDHTYWTGIYWPHLALEATHGPIEFSWFPRSQQHISPCSCT